MTGRVQCFRVWLPGFLRRHWSRVVFVVVLTLVAGVRLRLLDLPLERDEGEYAYVGQLLLEGVPPYKLAYNMKFPGTYVAYAFIMLVFGQTPAGIHLGLMCVTTLTALMLYRVGCRMLDETAGFVAATAYALLAASPALLGLAGHATHFAALFVAAGLLILWRADQRLNLWRVAVGGLMFGFATLMKQHAALFCLWGLWIVAAASRRLEVQWTGRGRLLLLFCAGVLTPLFVCCVALWWSGVLEQFVFWALNYASAYVRLVPLHKASQQILEALGKVGERDQLVWLTVLIGLGFVFADDRLHKYRVQLLAFFLVSLLTTVPGFYFRRHYFILMLPAAGLLAGCGVSAARALFESDKLKANGALPVLAYLGVITVNFIQNSDIWLKATPRQATVAMYFGNPFAESQVIADYIRTNSAPDAKVAILGSEPQIFFLSKRRSATGYIYTYPLMEPHPYAGWMHKQMIQEIESAKPEFVLFVLIPGSWLAGPESGTRIIEWWANSYRTNYMLAGVAVMKPPHDTQFLWGQAAVEFGEQPRLGILIYRRNAH